MVEPETFKQAMSGPWAEQWRKAAQEEYDSIIKMGVWELDNLPPGRKAIGNKWVFKLKRDADGTIKRFKACLVAQGFSQKYGVDYTDLCTSGKFRSNPTVNRCSRLSRVARPSSGHRDSVPEWRR